MVLVISLRGQLRTSICSSPSIWHQLDPGSPGDDGASRQRGMDPQHGRRPTNCSAATGSTRWRFARPTGIRAGFPWWRPRGPAAWPCGPGRRSSAAQGFIAWCIATTLLTVSRTAIAGMILGLALAFAGRRGSSLGVSCSASPCRWPYGSRRDGVRRAYLARGQTEAELESLTGRTGLYEEAHRRIERPGRWYGLSVGAGRSAATKTT